MRTTWRALRRFLRTPKGLLLPILLILAFLAASAPGPRFVLPGVAAAVAAAVLVDLPLWRWRRGNWEFPSGAILTGLIVAMVLSPHQPWWVAAATSAIGVAGKYVLRTRTANIFNPAALGLVVTFYPFHTGQSWWGAMPDNGTWALVLLFAAGIFIVDRVNKIPLVLAFLGLYYLLCTLAAYVGKPAEFAELFRSPDLQAALYFAFFILTDPPTSPAKYPDQWICGALVAAVSFAFFQWVGAAYYLLAGVLLGNLFEAWRRTSRQKPRVDPTEAADLAAMLRLARESS